MHPNLRGTLVVSWENLGDFSGQSSKKKGFEMGLGWVEWREAMGDKLRFNTSKHIKMCGELLHNVDYEGTELFQLSGNPPHTIWEEHYVGQVDGESFEDWWVESGKKEIRDWLLDMHPGICPPEVVAEIDELLGRS